MIDLSTADYLRQGSCSGSLHISRTCSAPSRLDLCLLLSFRSLTGLVAKAQVLKTARNKSYDPRRRSKWGCILHSERYFTYQIGLYRCTWDQRSDPSTLWKTRRCHSPQLSDAAKCLRYGLFHGKLDFGRYLVLKMVPFSRAQAGSTLR